MPVHRLRPRLSVSIDADVEQAIRTEAAAQKRPVAWVVEDLLRRGLRSASRARQAPKRPQAVKP